MLVDCCAAGEYIGGARQPEVPATIVDERAEGPGGGGGSAPQSGSYRVQGQSYVAAAVCTGEQLSETVRPLLQLLTALVL